ncbi:hypothetical protein Taro_027311 [Colocasia esculenta]|uniref:Uncharacterized protein n=1 Tax=Colocasia esculenta TaxID=4460 RepID=A0A843VFE1_COLES|nr:hypothetical protein [Colocasia esculenta]
MVATAFGIATMSRQPVASRQCCYGSGHRDSIRDSRSPGARHLRACPMREVVTVAWDPRPSAPVEGVLRAAGVLESRTLERREKRPVSPFLTASLFVAPEPLREARRGTVVRPDYDVAAGRALDGGGGAVVVVPAASSFFPLQLYVTLGACVIALLDPRIGDRENRVLGLGRGDFWIDRIRTEAYLRLRWRQRQEGGGRPRWRCRLVASTCERWRRRGESRRCYCRGGWWTTGVEVALPTEAALLRRGRADHRRGGGAAERGVRMEAMLLRRGTTETPSWGRGTGCRSPFRGTIERRIEPGHKWNVRVIGGYDIGEQGTNFISRMSIVIRFYCKIWQNKFSKLLEETKNGIFRDLEDITERNRQNLVHQNMTYRWGQMSIYQLRDDFVKTHQRELDRVEIFKMERCKDLPNGEDDSDDDSYPLE